MIFLILIPFLIIITIFSLYCLTHKSAKYILSPWQMDVDLSSSNIPFNHTRISSQSNHEIVLSYCFQKSNITVLLLHEARGNRMKLLERAEYFYDKGFSILVIDFQAHGESKGDRMTFGYLEKKDVITAINFIKEKAPDNKIIVNGISLGGAAAVLSQSEDIDLMVLEAVYADIKSAIYNRLKYKSPFLAPYVFKIMLLHLNIKAKVKTRDLEPYKAINKFNCPILLMAGDKDFHCQLDETKKLFSGIKSEKELILFKDAGHEDLMKYDMKLYKDSVDRFIAKI